jgi:hypothetical protein
MRNLPDNVSDSDPYFVGTPYANHKAVEVDYVAREHGLCCDHCNEAHDGEKNGTVWAIAKLGAQWPTVYCSDECAGEAEANRRAVLAYEAMADRVRE